MFNKLRIRIERFSRLDSFHFLPKADEDVHLKVEVNHLRTRAIFGQEESVARAKGELSPNHKPGGL